MTLRTFFIFLLAMLGPDLGRASSVADENPLLMQGTLSSYKIEPHQVLELKLSLELPEGFRAYEDQFKIHIESFKVQKFNISPTQEFYDENTKKKKIGVIDKAVLIAPIEASENLPEGDQQMRVQVTYQACTKTYCLFPTTKEVMIPFQGIPAPLAPQKSFWQMEFKDIFAKGLPLTFLFVFIAGLLTSFTPCVFPMIPITIAVLGRHAHLRSRKHNLLLSHLYVMGIAITYSLLGILAASTGKMFGSFISSPWVIGFVCLVFLAMSLSMFGLYELQPPAFIRDRFAGDLHVQGYSAAFMYGVVAGIVASPCVGPVLVGILTYIAQTQNIWLGFWLMFVFALGMGQLFLLIGVSSQATKLLPRSGRWMELVKKGLAIMMLGVCVYYLNMIIPISKMVQTLNLPTVSLFGGSKKDAIAAAAKIEVFAGWKTYSEQTLHEAAVDKKPVIIDFWAEWCAACHELDNKTFSTLEFKEAAQNFVLLKFDATSESTELDHLKNQYEIVGLPTVVFIDSNGKFRKDLTVNEFVDIQTFLQKMKALK